MSEGHPVDHLGRVLPDPGWPRDKAAPDPLDVIRRFCNTGNRETGADRFNTDEGLERWLESEGMFGVISSTGDRARIVRFREHVRSRALAHHDRVGDADLDAQLAVHVADLKLTLVVRDGHLDAVPSSGRLVDLAMGTVAIAIMRAQRDDCLKRFKACPRCEWVFYDRSKNESGRWCSMSACGGRAKVAAFRDRKKESSR